MEEVLKYMKFSSLSDKSEGEYQTCLIGITEMVGIHDVTKTDDILSIGFNPFVISGKFLKDLMSEIGFKPYPEVEKKGILTNWVIDLAKNNKANFGGGRLDCCDINNKKK